MSESAQNSLLGFREEKIIELVLKMGKVFKSGEENISLFRSQGERFDPSLISDKAHYKDRCWR